ncbi:CitMHS family transporter [Caulobacter sp. 602-1]|uniref:CitMHS family transporter n=1 Tax=Caulobacter sp. 602-1 TaxID=2492472 RepID=UPI000F637AA5|nr:citrate:proton symporter [Caulobacter sp. 602-1]RRN66174.1 citrate transporter [Caulobacter sp. 602-1]
MNSSLLAVTGFGMVAVFMTLIMTRRLSAVVALILVPVLVAAFCGFGPAMGPMIVKGLVKLAPTAAVLLFAVFYFGVMIDAGLFRPLVDRVLAMVGGDPRKVALGTAAVAAMVSLDGDGATTAMVTITAFLPIYRQLGMNPLILAVLLGSSNAIINMVPWGGPLARLAAVLQVDPNAIFLPLIPVMAVGLLGVAALAWRLGDVERRRLGVQDLAPDVWRVDPAQAAVARPKLWWLNLGLTIAVLLAAILRLAPLPVVFMVGFAIALTLNYPRLDDQRARLAAHAPAVMGIVVLVFAAATFTGVLEGTGMVGEMGKAFLAVLPPSWGPHLAVVTAFASGPMTFFLSNDAFFFGIVPIIAEMGQAYGIAPEAIARASLLGQTVHVLSPLVAAVYLVAGLLEVDVGAMQRFGLKWAVALMTLMILAAVAFGAVPLSGNSSVAPTAEAWAASVLARSAS